MAAVVIRNLSDAAHRALKRRAKQHGHSTEAEIRNILEDAVKDLPRKGLGDKLAEIGQRFGGIDLDITRSKEPIEPPVLE
jgi:antitoxin FitA